MKLILILCIASAVFAQAPPSTVVQTTTPGVVTDNGTTISVTGRSVGIGTTVPVPVSAPAGSLALTALYIGTPVCEDIGGNHLNLSTQPPYSTASPGLVCGTTPGGYPVGAVSWTAGSVSSGACVDQTIPVQGAAQGDLVVAGYPTLPAGIRPQFPYVSARGIVTIALCNFSGSPISVGTLLYSAAVIK